MIVRNNEILINPSAHPGTDKALHTWKEKITSAPIEGKKLVESVIKNTYRTLMTRGAKSCHLFCTDEETRNYFKKLVEGK